MCSMAMYLNQLAHHDHEYNIADEYQQPQTLWFKLISDTRRLGLTIITQ